MGALLVSLLGFAVLAAHAGEEIRVRETREIALLRADRAAGSADRLHLWLYAFGGARWQIAEIEAAVRGAGEILSQCGVVLSRAQLSVLEAPGRFHVYSTPVSRDLLGRINVRKPAVFFVDDTHQQPPFDAEAIGRANARSRPELVDTIWVVHGARDLPQTLAHELVHVLSDSGAHSETAGNLMREETGSHDTRLTAAQCEAMRSRGRQNGLLDGR